MVSTSGYVFDTVEEAIVAREMCNKYYAPLIPEGDIWIDYLIHNDIIYVPYDISVGFILTPVYGEPVEIILE